VSFFGLAALGVVVTSFRSASGGVRARVRVWGQGDVVSGWFRVVGVVNGDSSSVAGFGAHTRWRMCRASCDGSR
jgi:hypothetical protein